MPSPFPGMDPFLEDQWSAVHVKMAALKRLLPPGLVARPEESVRIDTTGGDRLQSYRPDLAVTETIGLADPAAGGVAVAEPARGVTPGIVIRRRRKVVVTRNIHIVDRRNANRVVTVVEVLSPQNKVPDRLNDDYRAKLADYEEAGANWVEIDLLRPPRQHLPVTWDMVPPDARRDYLVLTFESASGRVTAYPVGLRDRLPTVAIPLRPGDAEAALDLQAVFDRVYDEGPFADDTDYARPVDPPLSADDAAWAAAAVRAAVP